MRDGKRRERERVSERGRYGANTNRLSKKISQDDETALTGKSLGEKIEKVSQADISLVIIKHSSCVV